MVNDHSFIKVVKEGWSKQGEGSKLERVWQKLVMVKKKLKQLNTAEY